MMEAFLLLLLSIVLGALGQIGLKKGMLALPNFRLSELHVLIRSVPIWFGGFSYGLSILFYFVALRSIDLSLAYPTVSLGYVMVVILSKLFFGEQISRARWVAVLVICAGVVLVGLGTG